MFMEMPRKREGGNGRSVSLGVSMGPFSPHRMRKDGLLSDSKIPRPLSRVKFARPPRAGTLEDIVEPVHASPSKRTRK